MNRAYIWVLASTGLVALLLIGVAYQLVGVINVVASEGVLDNTRVSFVLATALGFIAMAVIQAAAKMEYAELVAKKYSTPKRPPLSA
jgi:4-hydroxybenzoate polyprenyltransferase